MSSELFTSTTTPTPTPGTPPDPSSVSPGVLGFVVVFLLAVATWLLLRNMTGRLRRMRAREERRLQGERDATTDQADEPEEHGVVDGDDPRGPQTG